MMPGFEHLRLQQAAVFPDEIVFGLKACVAHEQAVEIAVAQIDDQAAFVLIHIGKRHMRRVQFQPQRAHRDLHLAPDLVHRYAAIAGRVENLTLYRHLVRRLRDEQLADRHTAQQRRHAAGVIIVIVGHDKRVDGIDALLFQA